MKVVDLEILVAQGVQVAKASTGAEIFQIWEWYLVDSNSFSMPLQVQNKAILSLQLMARNALYSQATRQWARCWHPCQQSVQMAHRKEINWQRNRWMRWWLSKCRKWWAWIKVHHTLNLTQSNAEDLSKKLEMKSNHWSLRLLTSKSKRPTRSLKSKLERSRTKWQLKTSAYMTK